MLAERPPAKAATMVRETIPHNNYNSFYGKIKGVLKFLLQNPHHAPKHPLAYRHGRHRYRESLENKGFGSRCRRRWRRKITPFSEGIHKMFTFQEGRFLPKPTAHPAASRITASCSHTPSLSS